MNVHGSLWCLADQDQFSPASSFGLGEVFRDVRGGLCSRTRLQLEVNEPVAVVRREFVKLPHVQRGLLAVDRCVPREDEVPVDDTSTLRLGTNRRAALGSSGSHAGPPVQRPCVAGNIACRRRGEGTRYVGINPTTSTDLAAAVAGRSEAPARLCHDLVVLSDPRPVRATLSPARAVGCRPRRAFYLPDYSARRAPVLAPKARGPGSVLAPKAVESVLVV